MTIEQEVKDIDELFGKLGKSPKDVTCAVSGTMEAMKQWRDLVYSKDSGVTQVDIKYPPIVVCQNPMDKEPVIFKVTLVTDKKIRT